MTQIWWNNTLSFALQGFMGEASVRLKLLKISLSLCRERQNKSNIINAANGDPEGRPVAQSGWFEQLLYCQSQQKRQKSTDLTSVYGGHYYCQASKLYDGLEYYRGWTLLPQTSINFRTNMESYWLWTKVPALAHDAPNPDKMAKRCVKEVENGFFTDRKLNHQSLLFEVLSNGTCVMHQVGACKNAWYKISKILLLMIDKKYIIYYCPM